MSGSKWERTTKTDELLSRFGTNANTAGKNGTVQAWCYLCSSAHRFTEPCFGAVEPAPELPRCAYCGKEFTPPSPRHWHYCDSTCAYAARLARRRVSEKRKRAAA